ADQAVAWLSLAEEDDDPARFCRQMIESLGVENIRLAPEAALFWSAKGCRLLDPVLHPRPVSLCHYHCGTEPNLRGIFP
ncbi:hypothetical protein ACTVZD_24270, partial [Pseudomonas aeruginosa]